MSVDDLVKELRSAKTFDIVDARAKVEIAFDAATSFEERGQVLAVFKAIMDEGERQLISTQGNQSQSPLDLAVASGNFACWAISSPCEKCGIAAPSTAIFR